ncbi:MAG: metalloregulator ArsR/SmtB family transcription factor [Leptospirales bacterium]|nr:metalloregulator ArsR/SmtB family transcription factor [Leptospirales bacterium]
MTKLKERSALAALAEPRRCAILALLQGGELSAGAIHAAMSEVSKGAVSQHLRKLYEAGLVRRRSEGRRRFYKRTRGSSALLRNELDSMWAGALQRLALLAQLRQRKPRGPRKGRSARSRR